MIVRLLLWHLDEELRTVDELRADLDRLDPLPAPGTWLWNGATERFGALVVAHEGDDAPPALEEVRRLLGRDPDLYEEFDALDL